MAETEIRAMILAAGLGTRMQKAGESRPKPLFRVCGRPLIHYPLMLLARAGFSEVVINLHHRGDELRKELGASALGMKIVYLFEPEILGTGGGVRNADKHFPAPAWLTINADTIAELELKDLIAFHQKHDPLATMVLSQKQIGKFHPVFADRQGRVRGIGTKPAGTGPELAVSLFNFCGIQLLKRELLDYLPVGFSKMVEDGYLKALNAGREIKGYIFSGLWRTVDTPAAGREAEEEMCACPPRIFEFIK